MCSEVPATIDTVSGIMRILRFLVVDGKRYYCGKLWTVTQGHRLAPMISTLIYG
jgi:hypothetical protein